MDEMTNLEEKWIGAFLPDITQVEREECHLDEYLWHAFTYEKNTDVDSNFTWTYIYKHCDNESIWYKPNK